MKIYNNPNKVQVTFQKQVNSAAQNQSRGNSRSSSLHINKPHPNVVFDRPAPRRNSKIGQSQQVKHLPKKVSFHYGNNGQTAQQINVNNPLNYPPNPPIKNKTQLQNINRNRIISKPLQSQNNRNETKIRVNSIDRIDTSKDEKKLRQSHIFISKQHRTNQNNINNNNLNKKHHKIFQDHYLGNNKQRSNSINQNQNLIIGSNREKFIRKEQKKFIQRQRTDSGFSSQSSSKFIVQTVRQIKPDGSKGNPVEVKHRIETQYLTKLHNNEGNYRQNNHLNYHIQGPQRVVVNSGIHQTALPGNNVFYSPQHHTINYPLNGPIYDSRSPIISPHKGTFLNHPRPQLALNPTFVQIKNNENVQNNKLQRQFNEPKTEYSQVYSFPVREQLNQNKLLTSKKYIKSKNQIQPQQNFGTFPITSESRFEEVKPQQIGLQTWGVKKDNQKDFILEENRQSNVLQKIQGQNYVNLQKQQQNKHLYQTKNLKNTGQFEINTDRTNNIGSQQFQKTKNDNGQYYRQNLIASSRDNMLSLEPSISTTGNQLFSNKFLNQRKLQQTQMNTQIKKQTNIGFRQNIYNIQINNKKTITNKQFFDTNQFYSMSQQMIDEIFRNQTQKAVLKLKSIQHKYTSPATKRTYEHRSRQKKRY